MISKFIITIVFMASLLASTSLLAADTAAEKTKPQTTSTEKDTALFQSLFTDWTKAFNQKDLEKSCALFAKNMVGNYRGIPQKDYSSICEGFKKIFQEANKQYQYQFKLHQVYRSQNLAAVRITWYLTITENGKEISKIQDEGMDILEQNAEGKWQIVNYLAYAAME